MCTCHGRQEPESRRHLASRAPPNTQTQYQPSAQVCDHPALLSERAAHGIVSGVSRARRQAAARQAGGSSDVELIEDSSEAEELADSEEGEWESGERRSGWRTGRRAWEAFRASRSAVLPPLPLPKCLPSPPPPPPFPS